MNPAKNLTPLPEQPTSSRDPRALRIAAGSRHGTGHTAVSPQRRNAAKESEIQTQPGRWHPHKDQQGAVRTKRHGRSVQFAAQVAASGKGRRKRSDLTAAVNYNN